MVDITAKPHHPKNSIELDILQQEVIGLLDEINVLINNTQEDLNNASEVKYDQFQQQIAAAGQFVADLQLKMAIVAPMKAGKSTIINAIAGKELLPNCAVAMTTISTEIVFNTELAQPILYLSQEILNLFQNIDIAIAVLMANAAPKCLAAALNLRASR